MPGGGNDRRGPIATALGPLDFFLCGYMKNVVYQVKNKDLQQMKTCIRKALAAVTHSMPQNTWTEVEYRLGSRASSGGHVEI